MSSTFVGRINSGFSPSSIMILCLTNISVKPNRLDPLVAIGNPCNMSTTSLKYSCVYCTKLNCPSGMCSVSDSLSLAISLGVLYTCVLAFFIEGFCGSLNCASSTDDFISPGDSTCASSGDLA